jgi:hypothetical protein
MIKYIVLSVSLVALVGCAELQGAGFGFKDPEAGIAITCEPIQNAPGAPIVNKCSYIGKDGKEIFVQAPVKEAK